jgi:hypothetical protein
MEACVHRMLCTARTSGRVSLSGLWPKAELGSTYIGLGVFYLFQNGTLIRRVDKVRYGLQSHALRVESICAGRSLGGG